MDLSKETVKGLPFTKVLELRSWLDEMADDFRKTFGVAMPAAPRAQVAVAAVDTKPARGRPSKAQIEARRAEREADVLTEDFANVSERHRLMYIEETMSREEAIATAYDEAEAAQ